MRVLKAMTVSTLFLFLLLPIGVTAQDEGDSNIMYEAALLTPEGDNLKTLQENMRAHNREFHNADPYTAYVWSIATGPNVGKWVWVMGPVTYSDLDNRPSDDAHNNDWRDNVTPYLIEEGTVEYWTLDGDLSKEGAEGDYPMLFNRIWKVNLKYQFMVDDLLEKISETVKAMDDDTPWNVWINQFRQGDLGRHIITSTPMKNWAELEEDDNFVEKFKEIHGGDGAWYDFLSAMDKAFEDSYDEIWVLVPELGGADQE